jgi:hypothetical protein
LCETSSQIGLPEADTTAWVGWFVSRVVPGFQFLVIGAAVWYKLSERELQLQAPADALKDSC